MEWIRRLFVSPSEGELLTEARRLAFYLTAHFSQEDYPYDWQAHPITSLCVLMSLPRQADALAFQGAFY
jgi:hypothetical protein